MFLKKNLIFLLIFAVCVFFRFYNLSNVPPSPSLDEVSIGYNAYSILKTGSDEYGNKLPVLLRAYDDWRPALYAYLVIPFIKIFDLSVLSVRLPSAILSIFTGVALFFLAKEIFHKAKKFQIRGIEFSIAHIVFFLYSISPWNVYLSRLGHEVNLGFSFLVFGIFSFLKYVRSDRSWTLPLSAIFLALSFDAYQSTKIVVPIIVVFLSLLFYKKLLRNLKILLISAFLGILLIFPILYSSVAPQALIRFQATNITNSIQPELQKSAEQLILDTKNNNYLGQIIHNRRFVIAASVVSAYVSHLNPAWLTTNFGDEPFKVPSTGIISPFGFVLLLLGLFMGRTVMDKKLYLFLVFWILIGIIPGAITNGYPHAMRIYNSFPALLIFEGSGFYFLILSIGKINNKLLSKAFYLLVVFLSVFWISDFVNKYFVEFPQKLSSQFQYGVIDAFKYSKTIENNYDFVSVSNKNNLFQGYMFYLFANKTDPFKYQKKGGTVSGGFDKQHKIGKYQFVQNPIVGRSILYILDPAEVKNSMKVIKVIKLLNGEASIVLSENTK